MFKRPYCHICNHSSCTSIRNGYTEYRCTGLFFTSIHSPDYNPIELAFSKVKSLLKEHENEWKDFDVETAIMLRSTLLQVMTQILYGADLTDDINDYAIVLNT